MSAAAIDQARASAFLPRFYAGIAILAFWQIVVRAFAPAYVATPIGIVLAVPHVIVDPTFLLGGLITLAAVAEGLVVALAVGTVLGLVIGQSKIADRALRQYINACYTLPMVVVLPLVSLWFGYTSAARLATIVFAALFSIAVNVADGARSVPQEYLEVARSFRSRSWRTLFEIVLPAATPYFLAGLRLAAGRALIGAVVAEFFTAIPGLGYFILYNSRTFHHNEAFVAVLLLAAFGVGFDVLVNWITRRYLPWYRRDEPAN
ncbi:MAG TPA: ABC transporter permease [Stellaceae bacterium]|jgi:NitT/TauT family transport system permease protein|nr:ABC transporter permease [Stellaceae bacterium]